MENVNGITRKNPLFEMPRPTRKQSVWDTAIWLYRCRHFIQREDYLTQEQYEDALVAFCEEWENHYRSHPKVYSQVDANGKRKGPNKTFEKALMAQGYLERFKFEVKYHGGDPDYTKNILVYNHKDAPLFGTVKDAIIASVELYTKMVDKVFDAAEHDISDYKQELHEMILSLSNLQVMSLRLKKSELGDNAKYLLSPYNYEDIEAFLNSLPAQEREIFADRFMYWARANLSNSELLTRYNIPKTPYFDYFKPESKEKLPPKYMFVNIAFLLSLNRTRMEKVLNIGGYSLQENARNFDQIIHDAFNMGWSQAQTNAVINAKNKELFRQNPKATLLPTL